MQTIARDASAATEAGTNVNITVGTLTSGVAIAFVGCDSSVGTITGCTYGGKSMTQIGSQINTSSRGLAAFIILNPASGSNNVAGSATGATVRGVGAISFSGVTQNTTVDSTATKNNGAGTGGSITITTVADNCWVVSGYVDGDGGTGAGSTNWTLLGQNFSFEIGDSNAALTPAGNQTVGWGNNGGGGTGVGFFSVGLAPAPDIIYASIHLNHLRPKIFAPGNAK